MNDPCFHLLGKAAEGIDLPEKFTFPFHYVPHPLALLAARQLQQFIEQQSDWEHDFGFGETHNAYTSGKMFGVLVVKNTSGDLGYLSAFSGKLAGSVHQKGFVPPIFDMLEENGFYRSGEEELNQLNRKIEALEQADNYLFCANELEQLKQQSNLELNLAKDEFKKAKIARGKLREHQLGKISDEAYARLVEQLNAESRSHQFAYKDLTRAWKARIADAELRISGYLNEINSLKEIRRAKSNLLQDLLFEQYKFLNQELKFKDLKAIFGNEIPPSGAGDCAAPKLIQYAFKNEYALVCMAEFWWGKSPATEIRNHLSFYPACRGKCKPILSHMLEGVPMDENPLLEKPAERRWISILYEDNDLLVIVKPAELLSVPGKINQDSVYTQIREIRPSISGPVIVHRLDQSTSGIMLIPKHIEAYTHLQEQFISRKIQKRYEALLDGEIKSQEGKIELPLRVDLDDRPRQMVCFEHGKPALTHWCLKKNEGNFSRLYFFPHTGRTHQLRVHAAHPKGLGISIVGDELYGKPSGRLCLHAESITFSHPRTGKTMSFQNSPEF